MSPTRRIAFVTGVLFVITFIASIPAVILYDPVLNDVSYVLGGGSDFRIYLGAFLEIVLAVANIGTAVALFPIVKRQNEGVALGYVSSRVLESTVIVLGLISLLAVVSLRQDFAAGPGTDAASVAIVGKALVAFHDRTFLLGPAFCAGFGNGLLLGFLMYRSGLVPRRLALVGLIGGPVAFATATAVLFGAYEQTSTVNFLFTIPEIIWEGSLGVWLIVKGFSRSPLLDASPA